VLQSAGAVLFGHGPTLAENSLDFPMARLLLSISLVNPIDFEECA
jgi:hypothetical protein